MVNLYANIICCVLILFFLKYRHWSINFIYSRTLLVVEKVD